MGKKLKLIPFLFKPSEPPSSSSSSSSASSTWPWPACGSPKTLSFRADKIMNSVYVSESRFPNSADESSSVTVSTTDIEQFEDEYSGGAESIENVIRGVRSERLFFDAGESSSFIVGDDDDEQSNEKKIVSNGLIKRYPEEEEEEESLKTTVLMEMDSRDPFTDFKKSMEEMVEANGLKLKDWECLQELLSWYLKVNGKSNHGYIVGAFVDLLVALDFAASSSSSSSAASSCDGTEDDQNCSSGTTVITQSPVSALSFSSSSTSNISTISPCLSSLEEEEESATQIVHHHQEKILPHVDNDDHKASMSTL